MTLVAKGAAVINRTCHRSHRRTSLSTRKRQRGLDVGETLIEIVLTVVIIGISVTALLSGLATAGSAGNNQRISVQTDDVMRNYAEVTKAAARGCVVGGSYVVSFGAPKGFTVVSSPADTKCPDITSTKLVTLKVTGPTGIAKQMQIRLRTP